MTPAPGPRSATWLVVLVLLLGLLPSAPVGMKDWDTTVKAQVAHNLLEGQGPVLLYSTPDDAQFMVPGRNGKTYSYFPLLACLLWVLPLLVVKLGGPLLGGLPTLLLLVATGAFLAAWARRLGQGPEAALVGALLACLGTSLWPTAALEYDTVAEALGLAALLWAAAGPARLGDWLWVGVLLGAIFNVRQSSALLALPALLLALRQPPGGLGQAWRRLLALGLGGLPGLLLSQAYEYYRFHGVLHTWVGSSSLIGAFSLERVEALFGLLFSPGKGLFFYSPVLLVVLALLPRLLARWRVELLAIGGYGLGMWLFISRYYFWHGDWCWGPRYLAALGIAAAPLGWWATEQFLAGGPGRRAGLIAAGLLAVLLQAVPVAAQPVPLYFREVLLPLERAGRLTTTPVTRPPLPADWRLLYYDPRYSPLVVIWRGGLHQLRSEDHDDPLLLIKGLTQTLAAPLAALLGLLVLARRRQVG